MSFIFDDEEKEKEKINAAGHQPTQFNIELFSSIVLHKGLDKKTLLINISSFHFDQKMKISFGLQIVSTRK